MANYLPKRYRQGRAEPTPEEAEFFATGVFDEDPFLQYSQHEEETFPSSCYDSAPLQRAARKKNVGKRTPNDAQTPKAPHASRGMQKVPITQRKNYDSYRKKSELLDVLLGDDKKNLLDAFLGTERGALLDVCVNSDRSNLLDMLQNPAQIETLKTMLGVDSTIPKSRSGNKDADMWKRKAQKAEADYLQLQATMEEERRIRAQEIAAQQLHPSFEASCDVSQRLVESRVKALMQSFSGQMLQIFKQDYKAAPQEAIPEAKVLDQHLDVQQAVPAARSKKRVLDIKFLECPCIMEVGIQRATTFVECNSPYATPHKIFRILQRQSTKLVPLTAEGVFKLFCVVELVYNNASASEGGNLLVLSFPAMCTYNIALAKNLAYAMPCFEADPSPLEAFFLSYASLSQ